MRREREEAQISDPEGTCLQPSRAYWERFMRLALGEAQRGMREDEVPVGAIVVHDGRIIARAHNRPIRLHDPTAHAEILALRRAAKKLGNYRLTGCSLVVTVEPCAMCCGAMVHARISELIFGARDPNAREADSGRRSLNYAGLNPKMMVQGGVLEPECAAILRDFFARRRAGLILNGPLVSDRLPQRLNPQH